MSTDDKWEPPRIIVLGMPIPSARDDRPPPLRAQPPAEVADLGDFRKKRQTATAPDTAGPDVMRVRLNVENGTVESVAVIAGAEHVFVSDPDHAAELGRWYQRAAWELRCNLRRQTVEKAWRELQEGRLGELPAEPGIDLERLPKATAAGMVHSLRRYGVSEALAIEIAECVTGKHVPRHWPQCRAAALDFECVVRAVTLWHQHQRDRGLVPAGFRASAPGKWGDKWIKPSGSGVS